MKKTFQAIAIVLVAIVFLPITLVFDIITFLSKFTLKVSMKVTDYLVKAFDSIAVFIDDDYRGGRW
jgi:hypothetical protein